MLKSSGKHAHTTKI